jgi:hypothetical protein
MDLFSLRVERWDQASRMRLPIAKTWRLNVEDNECGDDAFLQSLHRGWAERFHGCRVECLGLSIPFLIPQEVAVFSVRKLELCVTVLPLRTVQALETMARPGASPRLRRLVVSEWTLARAAEKTRRALLALKTRGAVEWMQRREFASWRDGVIEDDHV